MQKRRGRSRRHDRLCGILARCTPGKSPLGLALAEFRAKIFVRFAQDVLQILAVQIAHADALQLRPDRRFELPEGGLPAWVRRPFRIGGATDQSIQTSATTGAGDRERQGLARAGRHRRLAGRLSRRRRTGRTYLLDGIVSAGRRDCRGRAICSRAASYCRRAEAHQIRFQEDSCGGKKEVSEDIGSQEEDFGSQEKEGCKEAAG
jgi:hypothetical protein